MSDEPIIPVPHGPPLELTRKAQEFGAEAYKVYHGVEWTSPLETEIEGAWRATGATEDWSVVRDLVKGTWDSTQERAAQGWPSMKVEPRDPQQAAPPKTTW